MTKLHLIIALLMMFALNLCAQNFKIKKKSNLYGVYLNKKNIVPHEYDQIEVFDSIFFLVDKKGKNGVLDQAGNPILPAKYDFIEDFDENYFFVRNEGKAGLSDKSGNIIVDLLFDRVHHYVTDTHAIVLFEEEWIKYNLETKEMISEEIIFKLVDEMPYYEKCADINISSYKEAKDCGDKRMLEYVYQNIQYPLEAREKGVQGVVVVKFIIDEEGNMNDIEIVKSVHESLDAVSLNITKSMSKRKWVPGKHGGQAVKVYFVFPIKFKLT